MSRKILTIFGATGNQGGSVIDVVLARPELHEQYALRGISRDPSSDKSKALSSKGVEVVKGDLGDVESLKAAVKGSHGVFGVTDFWSIKDKSKEIQQGKNIFDAAKAEGVKHIVWSTLPSVEKMTNGWLKHVDHFDGKSDVADYIEANRGEMISSYFMPAMFCSVTTSSTKAQNGVPTFALPFPDDSINFPLLEARRDSGKWIMGLFEGGKAANGVKVQGISCWTTPKKVVTALGHVAGQQVNFFPIPADQYEEIMVGIAGPVTGKEFREMMEFIGIYSYFGKGTEKIQSESDRWLLKDADLISYDKWAEENAPRKYE